MKTYDLAQILYSYTQLREALDLLLTEIDNLDDIRFSRDTDRYKAEACWEYAVDRATDALGKAAAEGPEAPRAA